MVTEISLRASHSQIWESVYFLARAVSISGKKSMSLDPFPAGAVDRKNSSRGYFRSLAMNRIQLRSVACVKPPIFCKADLTVNY